MKNYTLKLIIFLSALFLSTIKSEIKANHIIGGDMYYECLGFLNNDPRTNIRLYRVYLELYRDCQARNAAYFDSPAHMTVFRGSGNNFDRISVERSNFVGPVDIDPPNYPCLTVPPNVCVHKALYTFDLELEISAESYHVVWQRCCRNASISNIYDPGDIGASFTVEITPLAQQRCNNSPRFNTFPPTVICVDEPLIFDHSATDAEGDNIVYEFCAPLVGGGRNFGGNGCNSPNPDPDCPPPYGTVSYRSPTYTSTYPLAGNPRVTIDPITGLITGTPQNIGQFVVGVCVKEYRNGILLSTIRRDFQFNVSTCTPNFVATVLSDDVGPNGELIVRSCGNKNVKMENRSTGVIDSVLWEVDFGDSLYQSRVWSPLIEFPKGGTYDGIMVLNPNTPCTDTAFIKFEIVEEINASFSATYDTCDAGPVIFQDESIDKGSTINSWDWSFSARKKDTIQNPIVEYDEPGDYLITLVIKDEVGCSDTVRELITWQPAPEVIIIEPSVEEGCAPLEVTFTNLSYPIDNSYDVRWIYSDGSEETGLDAAHIFQDTGIYSVRVEITSPIGCYTERYFDKVISVFPPPDADFEMSKSQLDIFDRTLSLKDISRYAQGREWLINNFGVYFEEELEYTFEDTGRQVIQLISVDRFGCTDTLVKYVDLAPRNTLYFPNAFSPNGDGKNEVFVPVGLSEGARDYNLTVFNRWGELVFESDAVTEGWNGQKMNAGDQSLPGVYIYQYSYTKARGEKIEGSGYLTLVR